MGMALKAQAQSRATIQALVELKFPRQATFVRQANIANGPQQVNNAAVSSNETSMRTHARAHGETPEARNEILEDQRIGSTYLEPRAEAAAARGNTAVAALGAGDWPEEPRRQGKDEEQ
jgi:hypothetical protein